MPAGVFWPVLGYDFVNWDDPLNILDNPQIKGLGLENIKEILSSSAKISKYYIPLTYFSYAIDYTWFGLDAEAFHRTNLILHVLNTLLVFCFFYLLSQNPILAFGGAALFSVHPLNVEAVAWISERKGLMAFSFLLLALISYQRHLERASKNFYGAAILFFLLSFLSKPVGLMFPFLLLLLDRFHNRPWNPQALYEKIPFFIGSVLFGILSFWGQASGGAMGSRTTLSLENLLAAGYGVFIYLGKFFFPADLSAFYPYPQTIGFVYLLLTGALILEIVYLRKYREVFWSQVFFLVALLPAIKLVPFGDFVAADRLIYFPSLGLFFLSGFALYRLGRAIGATDIFRTTIVFLTLAVLLAILSGMSRDRLKVWQDGERIWKNVLEQYPGVALAHDNLGHHYVQKGRLEDGIAEYKKALALNPKDAITYNNLGTAYRRKGLLDEAIEAYQKALELNPSYAMAYTNLGVAYEQKGMVEEAISAHLKSLSLDPHNSLAHTNLGAAYMRQGMLEKAIKEHRRALGLDPSNAMAHANLGAAYGESGRLDEAIAEFKQTLAFDPYYAKAHYNLAVAYLRKNEMNLAEYHFDQAFKLGFKASPEILRMLKR